LFWFGGGCGERIKFDGLLGLIEAGVGLLGENVLVFLFHVWMVAFWSVFILLGE
jgi:hypothetical protein